MTKFEAQKYYTEQLAKHGWHVLNMLHIDDIKDRINGGTELVEMPSDEVLNEVCSYVASGHGFADYTDCVDWAIETINQWEKS